MRGRPSHGRCFGRTNSHYTGNEVRATMTRDFLKHALSMGLKRIGLDTHELSSTTPELSHEISGL
jgi:hypothetical protein